MNIPTADQPFVFSSSAQPGATATSLSDDLLQRTRSEIATILREVAALSRKPIGFDAYFAAVLDRVVIALAAHGAVLWNIGRETPQAIVRIGLVTDANLSDDAWATHDRLLQEVAAARSPVVVPPTPNVKDPHLPSNPTTYPVALVPIERHLTNEVHTANLDDYLIEVFLDTEGGVSTQRGYLRFVTQVADNAAEFLQLNELRCLRTESYWAEVADRSIDRILKLQSFAAAAAMIVDDASELFGFARVTLATIPSDGRFASNCQILAVSHVDAIDQRGPGVRDLRERVIAHLNGTPTLAPEDDLTVENVVRSSHDRLCLFVQTRPDSQCSTHGYRQFERWADRVLSLAQSHLRLESLPLARWYLAWAPQWNQIAPTLVRRLIVVTALSVAVVMTALIPTPMVIDLPATLQAQGTRVVFSPAEAVIEKAPVSHGQHVHQGDLLVKLRDWQLDEKLATLTARRALISQRLNRSVTSLVERPNSHQNASDRVSESDDELVQQQRLFEEELLGIDEQLMILEQAQQRLELRAAHAGTIDAWHLETIAIGRPVQRGEPLMRVIPEQASWLAEAQVDQSRLSLVKRRLDQATKSGLRVATLAEPHIKYQAHYTGRESISMSADQPNPPGLETTSPQQLMEFELTNMAQSKDDGTNTDQHAWPCGTPATVTIDCGKYPLIEVAFYDLIRAAQRTLARWL